MITITDVGDGGIVFTCGSLCWLLPIVGMMTLTCMLEKNHDGPHKTNVTLGDSQVKVDTDLYWTVTIDEVV